MANALLANRARVLSATAGTGTLTLGSAFSNFFCTFAEAGITDQQPVTYCIEEGTDFEIGHGVYTSAGTTLTRATVLISKIAGVAGTSKMALGGSENVRIIVAAEDFRVAMPGSAFGGAIGMANGTLVASVASNILTVAVKTLAGIDPSPNDPVTFYFRNSTIATGDITAVQVTAALSITTNAIGATLGTVNTVPFRLWVYAFNNAGTVVLALWQSVTGGASPTAIAALNEDAVQSTTAISGTATAAGTFYTPNGTTLTTKAFRIIGYVEYASGLTTAGTYASTPTKIQLFGPGQKKPGDVVQEVTTQTGASSTGTTTTPLDNTIPQITEGTEFMTATITPTSKINILQIESQAVVGDSVSSDVIIALHQDAVANALTAAVAPSGGINFGTNCFIRWQTLSQSVSAIVYRIRLGPTTAATITFNGVSGTQIFNGICNSMLRVREVMT